MQNKNTIGDVLRELSGTIERDIETATAKLIAVKQVMQLIGVSVPCEPVAAHATEPVSAKPKTKPKKRPKKKAKKAEALEKALELDVSSAPNVGTQERAVLDLLMQRRGNFVPAEDINDGANLGDVRRVGGVVGRLRDRGYPIDAAAVVRERGDEIPEDAKGYRLN